MNDEQYFALNELSNSRLGFIKCLRDNLEQFKAKEETFAFGTQFHQAALEPEKYAAALKVDPTYSKNRHKIAEMVKACKDNAVLCDLLNSPGLVEYVHRFDEARYGLKCKIKMDKFFENLKSILDLKTTAAKTLEEFLESIVKYGYHRQGAFYIDGACADRFIIVGICKTYPHKTFTVILPFDHPLIEQGRTEYEELIDYYITMPNKPDFKF
jgi:hypothetical protein